MLHNYFVYIVTNKNKTTLYVGMTNDIQRRTAQHYFDSIHFRKSFAGKYNCYYLLYYEAFNSPMDAIHREKQIKKFRREKKDKLISDFNPNWEFLNWDVF